MIDDSTIDLVRIDVERVSTLDAPNKALRPWHSTRKPPQGHVVTLTKPRGYKVKQLRIHSNHERTG